MTDDARQRDEPREEDLELGDYEADLVGGGDAATAQRANIGEISITKKIDVATPKLFNH